MSEETEIMDVLMCGLDESTKFAYDSVKEEPNLTSVIKQDFVK